jgi:hypothetical protein
MIARIHPDVICSNTLPQHNKTPVHEQPRSKTAIGAGDY